MKDLKNGKIGIRINEDLKEKLNNIADKQSRTLSNLITLILENYVEQKEREKI